MDTKETTEDRPQGQVGTDKPKEAIPPEEKKKTSLELWASLRQVDTQFGAKKLIVDTLKAVLDTNEKIIAKYNIIFLWTNDVIGDYELESIYRNSQSFNPKKGVLLIIHSPGGSAESAYLISKALKNTTSKPFHVAIPRRAKSAATLLSLGADEIHMSKIAELGPIDPQINGRPALGMQHALDYVSELVEQHPAASKMLAAYLAKTLPPVALGYSSRVAESAKQYAERLLADKADSLPKTHTPSSVATALVYEYKNHGFVIDCEESQKLLGKNIVKTDTPELTLALDLHQYLQDAQLAISQLNWRIILAGSVEDVLVIE